MHSPMPRDLEFTWGSLHPAAEGVWQKESGNKSEEFFKKLRSEKNSLNIKFLGGIFVGHPGPRRRDIPDKNFMQVAFSLSF